MLSGVSQHLSVMHMRNLRGLNSLKRTVRDICLHGDQEI